MLRNMFFFVPKFSLSGPKSVCQLNNAAVQLLDGADRDHGADGLTAQATGAADQSCSRSV